jgi:hypothetical protein
VAASGEVGYGPAVDSSTCSTQLVRQHDLPCAAARLGFGSDNVLLNGQGDTDNPLTSASAVVVP